MPSISIAEELAKKQREIAISEFFERNKHILGFDSLTKALITSVKEAVDNALDVTEECDILPDIVVELEKVDKDEYRIAVEDNGPGIVKKEVANVFARLLYGSRFSSRRQARGQQGLGISGVILYGQITTGKPAVVKTKTVEMDVAYNIQLMVDTRKNKPSIIKEDFSVWAKPHGTRVEVSVKGRYISGKQSIPEYLKSTAIVNPHARITFKPPEGEQIVFERVTEELPAKTVDVPPHPYGIELGTLLRMCKETKSYKFSSFLSEEFDRISSRVANEICELAGIDPGMRPKSITLDQAKAVLEATKNVKIMAPRTDCLSPIGERLIKKGLRNVLGALRPEFYAPPLSRAPSVYEGTPFQVEVGIVFGGEIPSDQPVEILRYANRVPLLYQSGACAITQAIAGVDWRRYGLDQRGGQGVPFGPAIILVHTASAKVPFTSEAKEAISTIPEITEEISLALKECGRRLKTHINKKARKAKAKEKFDIVQKVLPQIAAKSAKIVGKPTPNLDATVTKIMGVVWVEDRISYEKGKYFVDVDIHNFTPRGKKLSLHCLLPRNGTEIVKSEPKPSEVKEDGKVTWDLKRINSVEKASIRFMLSGMDQGDLEEVDLYVSGIPHELVIGAEPLPGDWELNYKEFEVEEETLPPEETDTETDYDESEEVLEDD